MFLHVVNENHDNNRECEFIFIRKIDDSYSLVFNYMEADVMMTWFEEHFIEESTLEKLLDTFEKYCQCLDTRISEAFNAQDWNPGEIFVINGTEYNFNNVPEYNFTFTQEWKNKVLNFFYGDNNNSDSFDIQR